MTALPLPLPMPLLLLLLLLAAVVAPAEDGRGGGSRREGAEDVHSPGLHRWSGGGGGVESRIGRLG